MYSFNVFQSCDTPLYTLLGGKAQESFPVFACVWPSDAKSRKVQTNTHTHSCTPHIKEVNLVLPEVVEIEFRIAQSAPYNSTQKYVEFLL